MSPVPSMRPLSLPFHRVRRAALRAALVALALTGLATSPAAAAEPACAPDATASTPVSHSAPVAQGKPDTAPAVNINTATATQLAFLPGIGQGRAERIVAYRTERPFKRVVELARVKGIGLKTVRKLKPFLTVTGETTAQGPLRLPKPAPAEPQAR